MKILLLLKEDIQVNRKTSVLKDLKEKQKEASVKAQVKDTVEKTAKSKGGEAL